MANFSYLFLQQASQIIIPLLIIPHLIKVLGYERTGLVFYAQSFMTYFIVLSDFGFNLTATQEISINRNNNSQISRIIGRVVSTKLFLAVGGLIILYLLTLSIDKFRADQELLLWSYLMAIGQASLPLWFFQGIEQMKVLALLSFLSRLLFLGLVYFFIRNIDDYIYVNAIMGIGGIFVSLCGYYLIYKKYKIAFKLTSWNSVVSELRKGWHIFMSGFFINVYMNSNIFVLSFVVDPTTLGYYGVAEKCYMGIRQVIGVISQAIYPRACVLAQEAHVKLVSFYKNVFIKFFVLVVLGCVLIIFVAKYLNLLFTHTQNEEITALIRLFSFLPLVVALNVPAYQTVIIYSFKKSYATILLLGAVINVFANVVLARAYAAQGTILSIYITELFITVSLYLLLEMKHNKYSLIGMFK